MFSAEFLLLLYTIGSVASFLPQIVKLFKTKHADDFSLSSWVLFVITSWTWLLYVWIYAFDIGAIFMSVLDMFLNIVVLVQSIYYQKHPGGRPRRKRAF